MRKFANFISYLFHPLFTIFYCCTLGVLFHPAIRDRMNGEYTWQLLSLILVSVVLIPLMSMYIIKRSGYISSWHIEKRKERIIPFFIIAVMMGISSYRFINDSVLVFCGVFTLAAAIGLLITLPFLYFWNKPSAHMLALSGAATAFIFEGMAWQNNTLLSIGAVFALIAGITGSSRLILKAHNLVEILIGALIGILVILPLL